MTAKLLKTGALLAATLVIAGCQGIPTSGPVMPGLQSFDQATQQVVYRPDMPVPGANQEEIVRGFLLAASSAVDDYGVAREFLSKSYRKMWDPYMAVFIDDGVRSYSQLLPGQGKLSLTGVATVNERGEMFATNADAKTEVTFELVKENGEWRIGSAPNGIILDRATFRDVWATYPLYFWSNSGDLVADQRWFLNRVATTNQVVTQLLEGPNEIYRGALTSSFSPGSALAQDAVVVEGGAASVALNREFLETSPDEISRAGVQLATTLNQLPGIVGYEITVDQADVMRGSVQSVQNFQVAGSAASAQHPEIVKDGMYGSLSASGFQGRPLLSTNLLELAPRSALSVVHEEAVIAQTSDAILWVRADGTRELLAGDKLLEPSLDLNGWIWTIDKKRPTHFDILNSSGEFFELETPWLLGQDPVAIRVSADSSKIAIVLNDEGSLRVVITGVVRDENGTPIQVNEASEVTAFWAEGNFVDMDWLDFQRVGVLSRIDGSTSRLTSGGNGFLSEERVTMQDAVALRGASRSSQALILDVNGDLWSPQGSSGWQKQAAEVTLLAKTG